MEYVEKNLSCGEISELHIDIYVYMTDVETCENYPHLSCGDISDLSTWQMWRILKLVHIWRNFKFLHNTVVICDLRYFVENLFCFVDKASSSESSVSSSSSPSSWSSPRPSSAVTTASLAFSAKSGHGQAAVTMSRSQLWFWSSGSGSWAEICKMKWWAIFVQGRTKQACRAKHQLRAQVILTCQMFVNFVKVKLLLTGCSKKGQSWWRWGLTHGYFSYIYFHVFHISIFISFLSWKTFWVFLISVVKHRRV